MIRVLLILIVLGLSGARKHVQDQFHVSVNEYTSIKICLLVFYHFQASCYSGCRCNQTVIECRNLKETSAEVFRHMLPEIFPSLTDIVVTGFNFGVLPDDNLFSGNNRHPGVSLANLSNNGIKAFGRCLLINPISNQLLDFRSTDGMVGHC